MKRWMVAGAGLMLLVCTGLWTVPGVLQGQATPAPVRDLVSYRDIVKKALPAVVSIESRQTRT